MTPTTEQLKEIMCVYGNTHPCYLAAAECLANREAQGTAVGMQYRVQVPNVTGWSLWHNGDGDKYREHYDVQQRLVYTAPPAPAVPETQHSSVIAEQLANVLSVMEVTDHQRAVIGCAVDRLNKTAEILQEKPAVPDISALTELIVDRLIDCSAADDDSIADAETFVYNACCAAMLDEPQGI